MMLLDLIAAHVARHRDAALAAENSRLRAEVCEVRAESTRRALRAAQATRDASRASQALAEFRSDIRDAHAILVTDNHRLRACGLLAAADMIEHNIDGHGLDFPDAAAAAAHFRKVAAGLEALAGASS